MVENSVPVGYDDNDDDNDNDDNNGDDNGSNVDFDEPLSVL